MLVIPIISVPTIAGHYLQFDGTTGYVNPGQKFTTTFKDSFWVNFWMKPDEIIPTVQGQICGVSYSTYDLEMFLSTTGKISANYYTNTVPIASAATDDVTFASGLEWKMITVVVEEVVVNTSARVLIYINSTLVKTGTTENVNMNAWGKVGVPINLYIGALNSVGDHIEHYKGSMDDFRLYSGLPPVGALAAIYNQGTGKRYIGEEAEGGTAVFALNMDEGTGTTTLDATQNLIGTLVDGVTWQDGGVPF